MSGKTPVSLIELRRASASARASKPKITYSSKKNGPNGPNIMSMLTAFAALTMVPPVAKPTLVQEEDLVRITAINAQITNLHKQKKDLSSQIEIAKKTCDNAAKAVSVALRDFISTSEAVRAHEAMHATFVPLSNVVNRASGVIVPQAHAFLRLPVNLLFAAASLVALPIDIARTAIIRTSGSAHIYARNHAQAQAKHTTVSLIHQSSVERLAALSSEFSAITDSICALSSQLDSIIHKRPITSSPMPSPAMCGGGGSAPAAAAEAAPSPISHHSDSDSDLSADLQILFGDN
jgi:hypothetical protein